MGEGRRGRGRAINKGKGKKRNMLQPIQEVYVEHGVIGSTTFGRELQESSRQERRRDEESVRERVAERDL